MLDRGELLGGDGREVGEVEAEPIFVDLRALLLGVGAEIFLQGVVEDVGGGVGAADGGAAAVVDDGLYLGTFAHRALEEVAFVDDELAVFLRVGHVELEAVADEAAGVADLAAAFAVERRAIEDDADAFGVADFVELVAEVIVRRMAGDDATDRGFGFERVVAEELGGVERLLERIDRAAGAHHGVLHLAGDFAVLFHRGIVALPIEGEVMFGGERFEELGRHAVGLIELGGDVRHRP